MDWSGGVSSDAAPTIAGPGNPNGLKPDQLAWANSVSLRHGCIQPRPGFADLAAFAVGIGIHQESRLYVPISEAFPYIIAQIAGRTFKVTVDTVPSVITEVTIPGDPNPPDRPQAWMTQGEEFLIIQDGISRPLIWDGVVLRRSAGPSQVLSEVASNFLVPAVGSSVLVTLDAPFQGPNGRIVYVDGRQYTASNVASGDWLTIRNDSNGSAGAVVPAGSSVNDAASVLLTSTTASFIIPIIGASTKIPVDPNFPSATPTTVGITNSVQSFTALDEIAPVAGANEVFLTNVSGIAGTTVAINAKLLSEGELPTAEPMVYYQGRIWLAIGREYIAGDIVGGPSGTAPYGRRDSILKMTENAYTALGGTFTVPTNAGNIRALNYPQNINSFLGQGPLLIFTRQQVYAADIPISRAAWAATTGSTGIVVKVMQINFGTTSDRSVVHVNGDVFYQSVDGVRSLTTAVRNFGEWGDLPISVEEARAIDQNDRALLRFGSGINFDNRLLETVLPYQTDCGVAHRGIMPLDFDLLSTLQTKLPPAWSGIWEGLPHLRLLRGDFGGRERAFSLARSDITGGIVVYELTNYLLEDNNTTGDARISWQFETPAFTWNKPFELKELDTLELWFDRLSGQVELAVEFRPDQHPCWEPWTKWIECAPRNNCEDCGILLPCSYPEQIYPKGYRATVVLPKPPTRCEYTQSRPINIGYSFQFRIRIKGSLRIRGIMVHAFDRDKQSYLSVTPGCFSAGCGT